MATNLPRQPGTSAGQKASSSSSSAAAVTAEIYEQKDEAYFGYYSMLSHQSQMLQDSVRTTAYQRAILENPADFQDKVVMDVGAGNGILSFFAAQAGARKVYAIEASNMVDCLKQVVRASKRGTSAPSEKEAQAQAAEVAHEKHVLEMMSANAPSSSPAKGLPVPTAFYATTNADEPRNAWLEDRLVPVHSKVEDVTPNHLEGHTQVDTIVSECLGVLLVHERMCESFLDARDRFLAPGGSVFPSAGTICLSPFEDKQLHTDTVNKARWWLNSNFHGVDVSPFAALAFEECFSSPVVGVYGPQCLLSVSSDYVIDFAKISKQELKDFTIPVEWTFAQPAIVHGLGGWFDLHFNSQSTAAGPSSTNGVNGHASGDHDMSDNTTTPTAAAAAAQQATPSTLSSAATDFQPSTHASASASALFNITQALNGIPSLAQTGTEIKSNFMTTSPYAEPTHWQQVRFLFPEPLAVNKGQKLSGTIRCQVNDQRSYSMLGNLALLNPDGSTIEALQRRVVWRLDRQTYSWS